MPKSVFDGEVKILVYNIFFIQKNIKIIIFKKIKYKQDVI